MSAYYIYYKSRYFEVNQVSTGYKIHLDLSDSIKETIVKTKQDIIPAIERAYSKIGFNNILEELTNDKEEQTK